MKILSIVGARPQFINAAVVSRALRATPGTHEILLHTGQHYDSNMSQVFFDELDIPRPDYNLGIGGGTQGENTGRMIEAIEKVLLKEKPDWVVVYGDTDSILAGALAAIKLHIPVAHVEAGLRSFNRRMPEEINRVVTDHVADLLFAPTETAVMNLRREGLPAERIALVGDVMYDATLYYAAKARTQSKVLQRLGLTPGSYILATIHRAENTDDPQRLETIMTALERAARRLPVVMPLHPRTRRALARLGRSPESFAALRLIAPVGYLDMLQLEQHAQQIVTDSGGVQKEAYFFRVPCVTLRTETEWVELVQRGWNRLIPPLSVEAVMQALTTPIAPEEDLSLYGDGAASQRIARLLRESSF